MYHVHNKQTDELMKMLVPPSVGRNSPFVVLTAEQFHAKLNALTAGVQRGKELFDGADESDLTTGAADGEDG